MLEKINIIEDLIDVLVRIAKEEAMAKICED